LKIFLCNEVIRDLDFPQQCVFARETGYDGLEIAPFTLSDRPHRMSAGEIGGFRAVAAAEGVKIPGLHWLLAAPPGLSITSEDDSVAAATLDFGRRLVDLCAELGGTYLVHGSPAQRGLEKGRESEGRRRGQAYLAAIAQTAEKAGVTYIIEPLSRLDTSFVTSVDEAVAMIEEIGSAALSTMIDCYAAASNAENIPLLLHRWATRGTVRHLHFNDDNRRGPGEGSTDFPAIIEALRTLDYSGTSAVEPFVYSPDGRSCAARAIGYLRGLLDHRQRADP
jgi:sugar phosphate isomerase/epimerase